MSALPPLLVSACANCHTRFLPRAGPCPKCGSRSVAPQPIAPEGAVLAAVELENPAAGWPAPHRLVLLEMAEGVRLLAVAAAPLPSIGDRVRVSRDGEVYRAETGTGPGRGEGESPAAGAHRPPFEPPR